MIHLAHSLCLHASAAMPDWFQAAVFTSSLLILPKLDFWPVRKVLYWIRIPDRSSHGILILTIFRKSSGAGHSPSTHLETCLPTDSPNLADLLVPLLGNLVFFSAILLQNKYICVYALCSSSFRKYLAFVLWLHLTIQVLSSHVWPAYLKLKLHFLHKFTVFALDSLNHTDTQPPNWFDSWSVFLELPWTFPLYYLPYITSKSRTQVSLTLLLVLLGLVAILPVSSWFSLTNLWLLLLGRKKETPREFQPPHPSPQQWPQFSFIISQTHRRGFNHIGYTSISWFLVQNTGS